MMVTKSLCSLATSPENHKAKGEQPFQEDALENNLPFDLTLNSGDQNVEDAVRELVDCGLVPLTRKDRACLKLIIENLAFCSKQGAAMRLSYHRGRSYYTEIRRNIKQRKWFNPHGIGRTGLLRNIDLLAELGFIDERRGFHDPNGKKSVLSRMWPTELFIEEFIKPFSLHQVAFAYKRKHREVEVQDDQDKTIKLFDKDPVYKGMVERVKAYNKLFSQTALSLHDNHYGLLEPDLKAIHRVFKRSSLNKLGRFYGGWWQTRSGEDRQTILIDDEETVELDYSGQHIGLLYGMTGTPMPRELQNNPYVVTNAEKRADMKLCVLRALNTKSRHIAFQSVNRQRFEDKKPDMPREEFDDLMAEFFSYHPTIEELFFQPDLSLTLQYLDSVVADAILENLIIGQEIPVLPVHDSFIVKARDTERLVQAMFDAYMTSDDPVIRNGYTSFKDKSAYDDVFSFDIN